MDTQKIADNFRVLKTHQSFFDVQVQIKLNLKTMTNYKSNNATMGEIVAQMLRYEGSNKPIHLDRKLTDRINQAESQQQHYSRSSSLHDLDEGQGPV